MRIPETLHTELVQGNLKFIDSSFASTYLSLRDSFPLFIRFSFASPKEKLQKKRGGRNMLPIAHSGPRPHFDRANPRCYYLIFNELNMDIDFSAASI